MTNLSVIKYKAPVIKISLVSQVGKQGFGAPMSTYFVKQPDGYSASIPSTIATTTYSGTGAVTSLAGSAPAAGTNVASSGGLTFSGSFASTTFDPKTTKTYADIGGLASRIGYAFHIATSFSPGMPSSGATAVLYSDTGSPAWAGTSVPLNGSFTIDPLLLSVGDIVRVKVTPAAPSAHLIGYSNEITFASAGVSFKRVTRTGPPSDSNASPVGTTNYIWFTGATLSSAVLKLFRVHKSTEVMEQVVNIRGDGVTDAPTVLGAIGDVVFFANNNTNGVTKLFSITEALVITQLSNHTNNQATSDQIANVAGSSLVQNFTSFLSGAGNLFFNNNLYFTAVNSSGAGFRKLFRVNGSGTIVQVTNTTGNQALADMTSASIIQFNGALYSSQTNSSGVSKLFKITSADVVTQIGDTRNNSTVSDAITLRRATTNYMYYSATNASGFQKLYRINTSDTPAQIANLTGSQTSSDSLNNSGFAAFNECFYFFGSVPISGNNTTRLFKINDAGTTLINIASTAAENTSGITGDVNQATLLPTPSTLFISMIGADGAMTLFYLTTSSDTIVRADQANPVQTIQSHQFDGSFVTGGRTFLLMSTGLEGIGNKTIWEVLADRSLRQLLSCHLGVPTITSGFKGHISGSDIWLPLVIWHGNQNFIVKMTLS